VEADEAEEDEAEYFEVSTTDALRRPGPFDDLFTLDDDGREVPPAGASAVGGQGRSPKGGRGRVAPRGGPWQQRRPLDQGQPTGSAGAGGGAGVTGSR
jgi:hypothetical protein